MRQLTDSERAQFDIDFVAATEAFTSDPKADFDKILYALAVDHERERVLAIVSKEFNSEYGVDVDDNSCECQSCRTCRAIRSRISGEKP